METENLVVKQKENLGTSTMNVFSFEFALKNELIQGDSLKFTFPRGFSFFQPEISHKDISCCSNIKILPNERMIMCEGFIKDLQGNTWEIITTKGVLDTRNKEKISEFYIEHIEEKNNVLEKISFPNVITLNQEQANSEAQKAFVDFSPGNNCNYSLKSLLKII